MALVSTVNPLASQPFHPHAQPATGHHLATPGKDSRWLTLELCREFQRGKCSRQDTECKYAHPPPHVEVQNGRVVCCYDSIKGKCQRKEPPCKYLHPPQHLKEQLLQNGRNNLLMKNLQLQMAGLTLPLLQTSYMPMSLTYSSYDGGKATSAAYPTSPSGYTTATVVPVVTHPYMLPNNLTISPYMTPMTLSTMQPVDTVATTSGTMPTTSTPLAKTTRTESAPPTISSSSVTNGAMTMSAGDQWTTAPLVSSANPYSPVYYQSMVPMVKGRPLANGEMKNGLHVYQPAAHTAYPQPMHLSPMQSAYMPVTGIQQQQQVAHY